jgi:hypothetical protein
MTLSAQTDEKRSTVENLCRAAGIVYKPPTESVVFQRGGGHRRPTATDESFYVDLDLLEGQSREDRIMAALQVLANDLGNKAAQSSLATRRSAQQFIERMQESRVTFEVFKIEDGTHGAYEVMATNAKWAKAYAQMAFPEIDAESIAVCQLHMLDLDWLVKNWESIDLDWITQREESRQTRAVEASNDIGR